MLFRSGVNTTKAKVVAFVFGAVTSRSPFHRLFDYWASGYPALHHHPAGGLRAADVALPLHVVLQLYSAGDL